MVLIEKSKNKKHFVPSESLWLRVGPFPTDSPYSWKYSSMASREKPSALSLRTTSL